MALWCQANMYLFKSNNINTGKRCEMCSELTVKTPEWRHWGRFGVFIVKVDYISHFFLVSLLLTLSMHLFFWVWADFCIDYWPENLKTFTDFLLEKLTKQISEHCIKTLLWCHFVNFVHGFASMAGGIVMNCLHVAVFMVKFPQPDRVFLVLPGNGLKKVHWIGNNLWRWKRVLPTSVMHKMRVKDRIFKKTQSCREELQQIVADTKWSIFVW